MWRPLHKYYVEWPLYKYYQCGGYNIRIYYEWWPGYIDFVDDDYATEGFSICEDH